MFRFIFAIFLLTFTGISLAVSVIDDTGKTITLDKPVKRIITLSPTLTEMIYAVGAEEMLVATVEYSNYPKAANDIPRIGNYEKFDMERLLLFKPDLVIGWMNANTANQLSQIEKLNIRVFRSEEPRQFSDIAKALRTFGTLLAKESAAEQAAKEFEDKLAQLVSRNKDKVKLNVFYQVWYQPIYTIGGEHVISRVMQLCGLNNVFADARILAPKVTHEAVIKKNPDIIISGGMASARPEWLDNWKIWKSMTAIKKKNLFWIHPDLIHRQSPRILQGAEIMCQHADTARQRLKKK